jgi:hypothetical protein
MKLKTKTELTKMSHYLRQHYEHWVNNSDGAIIGAYISRKIKHGKIKKRYALVFQVREKIKKPSFMIPKWVTIDIYPNRRRKVPTDVVEAGDLKLLSPSLGSCVKHTNTVPSVWGGVGVIVRRSNVQYLCTCMHVLMPHLINNGQTSFDNSSIPNKQADVEVWDNGMPPSLIAFCEEGYFGDDVDAAIARILDPNTLVNSLPIYGSLNGFKILKENDKDTFELTMMGSKSNIIKGKILQISVARTVMGINFYDIIKTDIAAVGGDSGSPVFGTKKKELIGIVFAGDYNTTYLIPISAILNRFGVSLL